MRKKIGFKFASATFSTVDGSDFVPKLRLLLQGYESEMRRLGLVDIYDLEQFMLYCSYVSRNIVELGVIDFDDRFSIDEVETCIGNEYVAAGFVDYYAELRAHGCVLPNLRGIEFRERDLSGAITMWAQMLASSGLSLMERGEGETASTIWSVLAEEYGSDSWSKRRGEHATSLSIANLATSLADVEGKTVLDLACGNVVYLATALSKGAASACGRDIDASAVMRAKIACFFADPAKSSDIANGDVLKATSATAPAECVFVAPPLGTRLRMSEVSDGGYAREMVAHATGEEAPRAVSVEDFCILKALDSLTEDGMAILHVSTGFLFQQQRTRQALRRMLVQDGRLQTVIELPGGCVPGSGVKSALLVLTARPNRGGVFIVDCDSKELDGKGLVSKGRGRCEITEAGIDWLVKTVEQREEIPLVATIVEREEILANGSSLCYSAYGEIVDYAAALDEVRSVDEILSDMRDAQLEVDALRGRIESTLELFKEKE